MHTRTSVSRVFLSAVFVLLAACGSAAFEFDQAALPSAKPWTSTPLDEDEGSFQFAVIGDRTGGERPGVYEQAVKCLNLLRPALVISVGDSIDGRRDTLDGLHEEWEEFDELVAELKMPFFYAVGNHDVANQTMKQAWLERRGADYYYFVYRKVLFLVLNTEDDSGRFEAGESEGSEPVAHFGEQQLSFVENTLTRHANVRWTLVFFHRPAWQNPSPSYVALEHLLADRNYTVFAGHLHSYSHEERSGHDHITLGPAGGAVYRQGPAAVDHISWVTMTERGPEIANIALDGIFDRLGPQ